MSTVERIIKIWTNSVYLLGSHHSQNKLLELIICHHGADGAPNSNIVAHVMLERSRNGLAAIVYDIHEE